jgi:RNA polymerase sigma-70 factor, ECF subfamily
MSGGRALGAVEGTWSGDGMAHSRPDREATDTREALPAESVAHDMFLVRRVRNGDMEAYGELVRRHTRRAFSIAYSILRHREDAEDVVQEAFIRTLERIERIEEGRPFHPWFFRIVVNRAISYQRSRSVRVSTPVREELRSDGPAPDRAVEHRELRERLLQAVDALPERQRTIVLLADVEELSSAEIADILEMPSGTVRYQLHLARRALREMLAAAHEEER